MWPAQHAAVADAAARLQDRGDSGSRFQFNRLPDLSVAAQLSGNPFGTRGSVIADPFCCECGESRFQNARCAISVVPALVVQGVVRMSVVLIARCAGVVRRPVMLIARCAGCGTKARCAETPLKQM